VREERQARAEAKAAEKKAQDDTLKWRDAVRAHWKEEEKRVGRLPLPSIAAAPAVADAAVQAAIQQVQEKKNMKCTSGYDFRKEENGYRCEGGNHFISFAELGIFA
jgi:hypothetical protein